jgi:hypothetical protein
VRPLHAAEAGTPVTPQRAIVQAQGAAIRHRAVVQIPVFQRAIVARPAAFRPADIHQNAAMTPAARRSHCLLIKSHG